MRSCFYGVVSSCLLGLSLTDAAHAQIAPALGQRAPSIELSYQSTRANASPGQCGCFYLQGGGAQLILPLRKSFSLVGDISGGSAVDAYKGYDLSLITYTAGPRLAVVYRRTEPFVQALVGGAHGSGLPFGNNSAQSANSFALVAGGGLDLSMKPRISLRLFELDYVHTGLPNTSNNRQNDLRLGAGIRFFLR